jgi:hypothetical protein
MGHGAIHWDTVAIVIPGMNEASSTRGGLNRCSELQNSHLLEEDRQNGKNKTNFILISPTESRTRDFRITLH